MTKTQVKVKKSGQSGTLLERNGDKCVVQFFNGSPYTNELSANELDFLPAPTVAELNQKFTNKFTKTMDEKSKPLTDNSEKVKVTPKKDGKK